MHVVVTGGASGIGASVAQRLIEGGHRVSVLDRAEESQWWGDLPTTSRGRWCVVDVSDRTAVTAAIDEAHEYPIDGLVTCAGTVARSGVLESTDEEFDRTMAINMGGTFSTARAVAKHMVADRRAGSIVTLMSTAGLGYVAGLGIGYHASKGAIAGMTWSMAGDLAQHGIRVNAVAPGLVRTPMSATEREQLGEDRLGARVPAGRLADSEELAAVIVWLLSPASALTTGHVIPVDGGQRAVVGAPGAGFVRPAVDTRSIDHPRPAFETVNSERGTS